MLSKTFTFPVDNSTLEIAAMTPMVTRKLLQFGSPPAPKYPEAPTAAEGELLTRFQIDRALELARLLLKSWTSKDGNKVDLSKPETARELIGDEPGLVGFIHQKGKELYEEAEEKLKVDAGN